MPKGDNLRIPGMASELGKKGAEAMKKNMPEIKRKRAERKAMREDMLWLLGTVMRGSYIDPGTEETSIEKLANRNGKNLSAQQTMTIALMLKASKGDMEAIKLIRDTIGEKEAEKLEVGVSYEDYVKNHKVKF